MNGVDSNSSQNVLSRVKRVLGPLGWGALIVFLISRCGDIATVLCRFFLGRVLSSQDFGGLDPVISLLAILGFPIAVVYQVATKSISRLRATGKEAECRALLADLARISAVGSFIGLAVVFGFKDFIIQRLHLESAVYIYIIAALFLVVWWQPLYQSLIQGDRNYRLLLVSGLVNSTLLLVLTVVLVGAFHMKLQGALLARVGGNLAAVVTVLFLLRSMFAGERRSYSDEFRLMKHMAAPMSVYCLSTTILLSFDRLFVRNFLLGDSGGYGAVITFGMIPLYFISSIVFVAFPLAAAEHARGKDLALFLRKAIILALLVTACCVAGLGLLAGPAFRLWNPTFAAYSHYVWLYALAMGLHGTVQVVSNVELARHRYGFLWFVLVPACAMCGVLYFWRSSVTVLWVLTAMIATHVLILAGVWIFGIVSANRYVEDNR